MNNVESFGLTLFGVAWGILAGVAHHAIEVPGSVFQHVIPGRQEIQTCKPTTWCPFNCGCATAGYDQMTQK